MVSLENATDALAVAIAGYPGFQSVKHLIHPKYWEISASGQHDGSSCNFSAFSL
jgi:hypothetical protein